MEAGSLPPFIGIRIKTLSAELHRRSLRTLDLFVSTVVDKAGALPAGFCVTVPKLQDVEQVRVIVEVLDELETGLGIEQIPIELMVETPQMIVDRDGSTGVRKWVEAAGGRVRGAHFGTYDYTASLNITAAYQSMDHPACDFARHVQQVSLAGTGVWISDGATNVMPVGDDPRCGRRSPCVSTTSTSVTRCPTPTTRAGTSTRPSWSRATPPSTPSSSRGSMPPGRVCRNFVQSAAKATLVGEVFDDAATGQGLLNYFLRAVACGAITEDEAISRTGLTVPELRTRSFLRIMESRRST